jgi:hypothetical protein
MVRLLRRAFPIPPLSVGKAEREVAGFQTYRELSRTLIATNEKICRARPVEDTRTPQEKKQKKRSGKKSSGK